MNDPKKGPFYVFAIAIFALIFMLLVVPIEIADRINSAFAGILLVITFLYVIIARDQVKESRKPLKICKKGDK